MKRILPLLAVAFIASPAAVGQISAVNKCPANAAVSLNVPSLRDGQTDAVATIANKGPRPLSAVFLKWTTVDSNGASSDAVSTVDFAPSGSNLGTGETVQTDFDFGADRPRVQSIAVTCAAVMFSDGGFWGTGKMPEVAKLKSLRAGSRVERQRLLKIYETQGSDALLIELKKPVPR
jgi:hypothetical protein